MRRTPSPAGASILITSAPKSPRWRAAPGPANTVAMSMTRNPSSAGTSKGLYEATVGQPAQRVVAIEAGEHRTGLLRPSERRGCIDATRELYVSALVHAVLRPGTGIILDACDLDDRDVSRRWEAARARAMRVTGEVARDRFATRDDGAQGVTVVGVHPEVRVVALARGRVPRVMVAVHEHGPGCCARKLVEPVELLARDAPTVGSRANGVEHREGDALEIDREGPIRGD